ncbi:MAG: acyl-homoserine-lactone synthase [Gammaproteobacteria bacterium]|nr:acyl-homoserine-lactone synthase [Gammaproteobacteria bacterium]
MTTIMTGRTTDTSMDWHALDGMYRLRDEVFAHRLGWDVRSNNGYERDVFDALNPIYIIARTENKKIRGCTRILPTIGPYMLRNVFQQLLQGEEAPTDENIWELSRFTADGDRDNPQASIGAISVALMRSAVEFAENNGIGRYMAVTSTAMERLLKRLGIPTRRLGEGQAMMIGKVSTVACEIIVDARTRAALFPNGTSTTPRRAAA